MQTTKYDKPEITKALLNSIASVEMEGYIFSDYHIKLCEDVISGIISKQECIKLLLLKPRANKRCVNQ